MKRKQLDGQLAFALEVDDAPSYTPGNCPHESRVVDIGGGKSYCDRMQAWTNCRCVGHCVYVDALKA